MQNNLLLMPIVDNLNIPKNHLVLPFFKIFWHRYFTVLVPHCGNVTVHDQGQIADIRFFGVHQLLQHILALLQEGFDLLRVDFCLFVAFIAAKTQSCGLIGGVRVVLAVQAEF